jgi:hypothetical protein
MRLLIPLAMLGVVAFAQQRAPRVVPEDNRPPRFFREDWKQAPVTDTKAPAVSERPVTQANLTSPNLELKLYGPGKADIQEVQHDSPKDDPTYIWTGLCAVNCALALRDRTNYVDLTGLAKIKWRSKQAGFHMLRPIVKLADGTWLVGDHADGYTTDWRESEFSIADIRWRGFDADKGNEANSGRWVDNPDLSKVDEIGFTDLTTGSGHGAGGSSRLDWIEVYGKPVPR